MMKYLTHMLEVFLASNFMVFISSYPIFIILVILIFVLYANREKFLKEKVIRVLGTLSLLVLGKFVIIIVVILLRY